MSTNTGSTGFGGLRPDQVVSGLLEDRLKPKPTIRDQVNVAAATLLAHLSKLPEHKAQDTDPSMEATSHRLTQLQALLAEHFEVEE